MTPRLDRSKVRQWAEDHGEIELLDMARSILFIDGPVFRDCPDCGEITADYRDGLGCEYCRECPICGRTLEVNGRCSRCLEFAS